MLAATDWNLIAIIGIAAMLAVVNGAGPAVAALRSIKLPSGLKPEPVIDSDAKPSEATLDYIRSITAITATPAQHLDALGRGDSPAEFMRRLLSSSKGAT